MPTREVRHHEMSGEDWCFAGSETPNPSGRRQCARTSWRAHDNQRFLCLVKWHRACGACAANESARGGSRRTMVCPSWTSNNVGQDGAKLILFRLFDRNQLNLPQRGHLVCLFLASFCLTSCLLCAVWDSRASSAANLVLIERRRRLFRVDAWRVLEERDWFAF